ncbi:MAG: UvrB/UvrC motif-containing protein [Eubacteriales bacterium]|nr:UvrB/UvrC motif-containing protein [Eubacteriales bacterium]
MICEICNKNEGNIVFQVYNNGEITTRTICTECAMSAQNEFFKALHIIANKARRGKIKSDAGEKLPESFCPECGNAIGDLNEDSVFGCPQCYNAARDRLKRIKGLLPEEQVLEEQEREIKSEEILEELHHQLRTAIVAEDFERAAKLRDEITETEKSISHQGGFDE